MKSIEAQTSLNMHPGTVSLLDEQREDEALAPHIERLEQTSSVRASDERYELQKHTGVLRKREKGKYRICAPKSSEELIMYMYHDHKLSGHMAADRMMRAIRETYTFPGMGKKVDKWCKHCHCSKAKATLHPSRGMTMSRPLYGLYRYVVMDIVGAFPRSRRRNEYWLTIMDAFSKDLELIPLKSKEAVEVARALLIHWVCRRGVPVAILSDNAKEFTGKVATHLCEALGMRSDLIAAYHHESAGLVERVHRI